MWLGDPDVVITLFFEVPSLVIGRSSWVSTIPSRIPTRLHRGTCTLGYFSLASIGSSYPLEVINGAPLPVGHLFPGRCPKLGKLLISSSHQSARSKHLTSLVLNSQKPVGSYFLEWHLPQNWTRRWTPGSGCFLQPGQELSLRDFPCFSWRRDCVANERYGKSYYLMTICTNHDNLHHHDNDHHHHHRHPAFVFNSLWVPGMRKTRT